MGALAHRAMVMAGRVGAMQSQKHGSLCVGVATTLLQRRRQTWKGDERPDGYVAGASAATGGAAEAAQPPLAGSRHGWAALF